MADRPIGTFNVMTKLVEMAGYQWKVISHGGEPVEQLEGRGAGAVRRSLEKKGFGIIGDDMPATTRTRSTAGTQRMPMSGTAGARPRTASRGMTARSSGNGQTAGRARASKATPRKRARLPAGR